MMNFKMFLNTSSTTMTTLLVVVVVLNIYKHQTGARWNWFNDDHRRDWCAIYFVREGTYTRARSLSQLKIGKNKNNNKFYFMALNACFAYWTIFLYLFLLIFFSFDFFKKYIRCASIAQYLVNSFKFFRS